MANLIGRPPDKIIGEKYSTILPRINNKGDKDALAEVVRKKRPLVLRGYRFACLHSYGTADIWVSPVKDHNGSLRRVKVTLRPRITCSAANKLHQSQKLVNIGKIASTLAHGVRNPLNAIKGAVVYLQGKYTNEQPLQEFTKIMEEEISRLENFISRFLSSSVSETEVRETDINAIIKKIEIFTSLQIYTRNIRSHYDLGNIPPITINSFHLEQAILNVINNAIEAMNGGGQLNIITRVEARSGNDFVVIAISDTGPGMGKSRIGDLSSDTKNNGKGFGLFITYEILKHYGGHLEIDSKMNMGTTIKLFIPSKRAL
jgi:two-component system nitrogen regulation sensor histidine kinase GlnL